MTTKTTLDLVIVSDITKVKVSSVLDASIADHKLVYASLNLKRKRPPPQLATVRNYKNLGCLYTDTEYQIIDQNYEIILID